MRPASDWAAGAALGGSFWLLAWARRRSGVGRRANLGALAQPSDAWASIAQQRRKDLAAGFVYWGVALVVLWALFITAIDGVMTWSRPIGFALWLIIGAIILWLAFTFAIKIGYRYGVVDAATLWEERARKEGRVI